MSDLSVVNEALRNGLAVWCRNPGKRLNYPDFDGPHRWTPGKVIDSVTLSRFTDREAWNFIAECLENDCHVKYKRPTPEYPDHAYVMIECMENSGLGIYMKIALKMGVPKVIGVSFHQ
jgi:hypothetical protein